MATQITNCKDLQNIGSTGSYELVNNIDCSETKNWNERAGFAPLCDSETFFSGTLDGKDYIVSNLYIYRPSTDWVGLFSAIGSNSKISNIRLQHAQITGHYTVGGLVSYNCGNILYSSSIGDITGLGAVGGLVGQNRPGSILNSYSISNISGNDNSLGGLVGGNYGIISNSYSSGSISKHNANYIGGLVGTNGGFISNSYSMTSVTGRNYIGGLSGDSWSNVTISNCYSTGRVDGITYEGGLVGTTYDSNTVSSSYYDEDTSGQYDLGKGTPESTTKMMQQATFIGWDFNNVWAINEANDYPKLIWQMPHKITYCEELQNIAANTDYELAQDVDCSGTKNWNHGAGFQPISTFYGTLNGNNYAINELYISSSASYVGLFGSIESSAKISNLKLINSNITSLNATYSFVNVGSLAGVNSGQIFNVHSEGNIISANQGIVGGLVGYNSYRDISYSSSADNIISKGYATGGLIGQSDGTIKNCWSSSDVKQITQGTGQFQPATGGLVGAVSGGEVLYSYATGTVASTIQGRTGGLVGELGIPNFVDSAGTISYSYATGQVTGTNYTGGLIGAAWSTSSILNSYATGDVFGNQYVGGLIGDCNEHPDLNAINLNYSYSVGYVKGNSHFGGLIGAVFSWNPINASNSYYNRDTSGQSDTGKGIPESTEKMMEQETFIGWDFINTWTIDEGVSYPTLKWQDQLPTPTPNAKSHHLMTPIPHEEPPHPTLIPPHDHSSGILIAEIAGGVVGGIVLIGAGVLTYMKCIKPMLSSGEHDPLLTDT